MTPRPGTIAAVVAFCWLAGAGVVRAEPAAIVRNNGPSANRVDIVVMGDGFTAAQIASGYYAAQIEALVQRLFAQEPYLEYQRFFNVIRIDVTSADAGADHPSRGIDVNTALGATYDCAGITRLICVNQSEVNAVLARTAVPANARDIVLVIVNDPEYGGSGGSVAVASLHLDATELILHESGHTFALLADEYGGPPPPQCSGTEPVNANATRVTVRNLIRWAHWIDPATPIPTIGFTVGVPGLYEGAVYCDTGVYRPTYNSKMRSLYRPFEQVNTEQHVLRIYNRVSPIDSWSPAATAVSVVPGVPSLFSVTGPLPRTHLPSVTWVVDGTPVANTAQFDASTLPGGLHRLEVRVSDPTALVRRDPAGLLTDTHAWDVTVAVADPGQVPGNLAASVVGNLVTLSWTAPSAFPPTGYVIRGGSSPGEVAASLPTGSTATTLTASAPTGVFYVRVHALAGAVMSAPSNEIQVAVNMPAAPSAPVNLLGSGSGSTLFLAWQNTAAGGTPTAIRLDVSGTLAGSALLPVQETFSFLGVPPGTYTFAVSAANGTGSSAPSNSVTVQFPATCAVPDVPTGLAATMSGGLLTLTWQLPPAGAAPTGYQVSATGTHAGSAATATRSLSAAAPPGSYAVTVAAVNPCGTSAPSAPLQITIP